MNTFELNPWKVQSKKEVYENAWIRLTEFEVLNPNGNPGIYGKVHFKNLAIGIVALNEKDELCLVGQYRFPTDTYSWEIPEGGGPLEADPLESAKRELLEETGFKAQKWEELFRMHLSNSVSDELAIVYLATKLEQCEASPEDTEVFQHRTLSLIQAWGEVKSGKITDAISVAAIQFMVLRKLGA
ncbi:MAG: NUDIX domain-containing protein [Bacteroidia bacterium]